MCVTGESKGQQETNNNNNNTNQSIKLDIFVCQLTDVTEFGQSLLYVNHGRTTKSMENLKKCS